MYWENLPGRSKPAYLDLCLETIKKYMLGMSQDSTLWVENGPAMFRRILPKYAFYSYPLSRGGGIDWPQHETYYREMDDISSYLQGPALSL